MAIEVQLRVRSGWFRIETLYAPICLSLAPLHALFMTYVFPREWVNTPQAQAFADRVASIVPAINTLINTVPDQYGYWKLFYAIFWVMVPILIALGMIGQKFLREKDKIKIQERSTPQLVLAALGFASIVIFMMFYAVSNPSGPKKCMNLTSSNVLFCYGVGLFWALSSIWLGQ